MKIKKIIINGIGGIHNLTVEFNSNFNLICGPNGVGKTTILECIGHSFSQIQSNLLKRNVRSQEGRYSVEIEVNDIVQSKSFSTKDFHPWDKQDIVRGFRDNAKNIIVFKTSRSFQYLNLTSLSRDKDKGDGVCLNEASIGVDQSDIKNWFVQRHMWSKHDNHLAPEQLENLALAKNVFSLLSSDISFLKVTPDTFDILVKNNSGEIYYEYLSSGYKSCLIMLLGLIKEIEIRNKDPKVAAKDFDGIVLIDEIDLHLHPDWQARLSIILKSVFPKAQFIVTTHSPHIIQAAEPNEIIPLEIRDLEVGIRDLPSREFGYKGWTIEEILTDVMGMETTKSKFFNELLVSFFTSVDEEEEVGALEAWEKFDKILHPRNEWRKILKLHMSSIGVEV